MKAYWLGCQKTGLRVEHICWVPGKANHHTVVTQRDQTRTAVASASEGGDGSYQLPFHSSQSRARIISLEPCKREGCKLKLRKLEGFITLGHKKPGFAVFQKIELKRLELRGRDLFSQTDRPTVSVLTGPSLAERWPPQRDTRSLHKEEQACERTHAALLWDIVLGGWRLPWRLSCKEYTCQCRRFRFNTWVEKIPWGRAWQPTPVFLPGESYGQRNQVGYSPWGCKESDTTESLNNDNLVGEDAQWKLEVRLSGIWAAPE